jgi:AraC-like DNA-binding protein
MNAPAPTHTSVPETWTTDGLPPRRQFDAWREVIVDAHLSWDIPKIACDRFPAFMRQHRLGGVRLTDCTSAATVSGTRERRQIARDDSAWLSVVMVAQGTETLRFDDDRELQLGAGMFTLWDSTRPMAFRTSDDLRQMSMLVPEAELLRRLPRVRDLIGRPMDGRQGAGALFVEHFQLLMRRFGELPATGRQVALGGALDLLRLCLGEQPAPGLRQLVREQLQRHIERHLAEPSLGVAMLARRFRMSERNVHKLFEGSGETVSGFIRDRRLAMCRRDLEAPAMATRPIAEIARHWGFEDPSHFSKVFRAAYGVSARELRATAGR